MANSDRYINPLTKELYACTCTVHTKIVINYEIILKARWLHSQVTNNMYPTDKSTSDIGINIV